MAELNEIKIFAPATVANVSCGFDVLGFCLDTVGDEMIVRMSPEKGVRITKIAGSDLPLETHKNVAGVSAMALLETLNPNCGFEIEIYKNIKPGSGIGSSAASAAGSVFAINELLGRPLNKTQLTAYAMKGEALASQCEHAENIAPCIFGGFTLVKGVKPLEILELPTPSHLFATIIHPQIEIKTSEARAILPKEIPLSNAIEQWANVGSLVHALHTSNYNLLSASLKDIIVEPYRKQLIPEFDTIKSKTLEAGALGVGISGSGPSIFALCNGETLADKVAETMYSVYQKSGIDFNIHISPINKQGIKVI